MPEEAVLDTPVDAAVETPITAPTTTPAAAATDPASEEVVLDLGVKKPVSPKDLSDEELARLPENDARKWGRDWKSTAKTYEAAHTVAQEFGGVENLKLVKPVWDVVMSPNPDPQAFIGAMGKIDPQFTAKLLSFAGAQSGGNSKEAILTELFGSIPTHKDVEAFRQFKAADGKLVSVPGGDPIPERFLYNEAIDDDTGEAVKTLRTQKEMDADPNYRDWKELQRQRTEHNEQTARETKEKQQAEQKRQFDEREALVDKKIDEWHKPLDIALEQLGMLPDPADMPEVAKEKRLVTRALSGAIREEFDQNPDCNKLLQTATQYIRSGRADLVDSLGYSDRIMGIVADIITDMYGTVLKGGVRARAKTVQAAVNKQQPTNPNVNGNSGGLGQTSIQAPANMNDTKAVTEWMNQVHLEAVNRQMRPNG